MRAVVPDLELRLRALPDEALTTARVELAVAVDEQGKPVDCADYPPIKGSPYKHFPQLVPVACKQVLAGWQMTAPKDDAGKPARSVQSLLVYFTADKK